MISAIATIEANRQIAKLDPVALSYWNIFDCADGHGDAIINTFYYINSTRVEQESDYPKHNATCGYDASKGKVSIQKYKIVDRWNAEALKTTIANSGPVWASIDATS